MEKTYHSLKDFELSYGKNAIERANDFQQYIEQLNDFGCKSYWITSHTGIGSTLPLCQKFSNIFSNTDIDIVTISALIIGGIYYLILHDKLSTFSEIDLKKESDKQKVIKAISKLSDILFTFIPSSITKENIDIIIKMREDNIPVEKIAYYTGIPKEIIVSI